MRNAPVHNIRKAFAKANGSAAVDDEAETVFDFPGPSIKSCDGRILSLEEYFEHWFLE